MAARPRRAPQVRSDNDNGDGNSALSRGGSSKKDSPRLWALQIKAGKRPRHQVPQTLLENCGTTRDGICRVMVHCNPLGYFLGTSVVLWVQSLSGLVASMRRFELGVVDTNIKRLKNEST